MTASHEDKSPAVIVTVDGRDQLFLHSSVSCHMKIFMPLVVFEDTVSVSSFAARKIKCDVLLGGFDMLHA